MSIDWSTIYQPLADMMEEMFIAMLPSALKILGVFMVCELGLMFFRRMLDDGDTMEWKVIDEPPETFWEIE